MSRLIRMDGSGHTTLAEWTSGDGAGEEAAIAAFRRELDAGMIGSVTLPERQRRGRSRAAARRRARRDAAPDRRRLTPAG